MERAANSKRVGLARALSKLGYCSRSQAAALILAGRVQLNGTTRRDPETPVHLHHDRIKVDRSIVRAESRIYLVLNKPRGVVTTASDERDRETVYSFLGDGLPWVGPVGRLDKASEGLLLLTNDSEWAARISDPRTHVDKIYHVQIGALADEGLEPALTGGVHTASGEVLRAKQARVLRTGDRNAWLEIVLDEGKKPADPAHVRALGNRSAAAYSRRGWSALFGPISQGQISSPYGEREGGDGSSYKNFMSREFASLGQERSLKYQGTHREGRSGRGLYRNFIQSLAYIANQNVPAKGLLERLGARG